MRRWPFGLVCFVFMLIFSVVVYGMLPERVPIHWNINGEVDDYGSRLFGVALAPAITLLLLIMGPLLPRLDPNQARYEEFRGSYYLILNGIAFFMLVVHISTLGFALGWPLSMALIIQVAVGLLMALLGNELGRIRPNWFVGIRTPWTLSNEEVWRRTHRVSGRLLTVVGLVIALIVPLLPPIAGFVLMVIGIFGFAAFSIGYSYLIWRQTVGMQ